MPAILVGSNPTGPTISSGSMPLFAQVAVIFGRFLGIFRLSSAVWGQTAVGKRQGARDFEPPVFPVQGFTRTPRSTCTGLDEHRTSLVRHFAHELILCISSSKPFARNRNNRKVGNVTLPKRCVAKQ